MLKLRLITATHGADLKLYISYSIYIYIISYSIYTYCKHSLTMNVKSTRRSYIISFEFLPNFGHDVKYQKKNIENKKQIEKSTYF